jgi:hypothetical protein
MLSLILAIICTCTVFVSCGDLLANTSDRTDLSIRNTKFYGHFEGGSHENVRVRIFLNDKRITLRKGEKVRLEISQYNEIDGISPQEFDVETEVSNTGDKHVKEIEVRLSIVPKVAYFVFWGSSDVKMIDHEESEKTAQWFTAIDIKRKTIDRLAPNTSTKVIFERINLKGIIDSYFHKELWVTDLKCEISVEPQGQELTFQNNTNSKTLRILFPPY